MKKIILLGLLIFSTQSFSQKIIQGKEKKTKKTEFNKDSTVKTVTITIMRTDTIKTRYSPEMKEVRRETNQILEKYDQKLEKYLNYDVRNKELENEKEELERQRKRLESTKTNLKNQIRKLENIIRQDEDDKDKEKENIRKAINSIIQQKSGKSSGEAAVIIKEMAKKYTDIDKKDLKLYIQMNKKFVAAKDLLNKPYNKENIKNNKNNLISLVIPNKFSGLLKEKREIINLLKGYEDMCNTLAKELKDFKDLNASRDQIKKQLKKLQKENIYRGYPYLLDKMQEKIDSPKKTISLKCN